MKEPIKIKIKLSGGEDSVIPKGVIETLLVQIQDGKAWFKFVSANTTRNFAIKSKQSIEKGDKVEYVERIQSALFTFPNKDQEEIYKSFVEKYKYLETHNKKGEKIK
jgi:flagella basal body P-ring formation protein FlgA